MQKYWYLLFGILGPIALWGQELPPIQHYPPETYQGGNQNWMLSQGPEGYLYAANNDGLLEFDGARWRLYPSPNESLIRSVYAAEDRIYSGCYMEFGYWMRQSDGSLQYHSLSNSIPDQLISDEQFWRIFPFEGRVLFQSLDQVVVYDPETESVHPLLIIPQLSKVFPIGHRLFFYASKRGVFEILDSTAQQLIPQSQLEQSDIVYIAELDRGLLLFTHDRGLLHWNGQALSEWSIPAQALLKSVTSFSACSLPTGGWAIGTIGDGVIILDQKGAIRHHIQQLNGLSNNTVLTVHPTRDGNLWLGLDHGINCVNLAAPYRTYTDNSGRLGTIYAAILHENRLYIGTNQGLFYRDEPDSNAFRVVPGTEGQVWSLNVYQEQLLCGHNLGTFLINGTTAQNIFALTGTWDIRPFPGSPNRLLQGNYEGFSVLAFRNGKWQFEYQIEGFDFSAKQFEPTADGRIFMNHEYRGLFELTLNPKGRQIETINTFAHQNSGKNSGLIRFDDGVMYANREGIFPYSDEAERFLADTLLSDLYAPEDYMSGRMVRDASEGVWLFSRNFLFRMRPGRISDRPDIDRVPLPYDRVHPLQGYENICPLGAERYLIGSTDGYLIIDLNQLSYPEKTVEIRRIIAQQKEGTTRLLDLSKSGTFSPQENILLFQYTVATLGNFLPVHYRYRLRGFYDAWSDWSKESETRFENLPAGDYTFEVQARISYQPMEQTTAFTFVVAPPWYRSTGAFFLYTLLFISAGFGIHILYRRYYRQQRERLLAENQQTLRTQKLEAQQEIMQLKNEQLQQDVAGKNRELAVSTMSLIKTNELLIDLRDRLKALGDRAADGSELAAVLRTIDRSIDEEDTWKSFRQAFNHADNQFFQKLKELHPDLTPSELRLCAYLRLNLTSKEIAPLMNISVRSIEIKRYRLRKKMNLPHSSNLVNYILDI